MVLFYQHKLKKKRLLSVITMITLCLFTATTGLKAQGYIEVPIKLDIEKGHLDNGVIIKVKKDGKDAFTQSGSGKLRFKFNYNMVYTLIFTKEGYISKTIEFDTHVPPARLKAGFDPYAIGVKLFPQENESHKVVYNQAVGKIRYDKELDEFGYDTDYSKSILSKMEDQTAAAETTDPAANANDSTTQQSKNNDSEKLSAKEERRNKKKLEEEKAEAEKLAMKEKKEILKQEAEKKAQAKQAEKEAAASNESKKKLRGSRDGSTDNMLAMAGSGAEEPGIPRNGGAANDINKPRLSNDGNDVNKTEPKDQGADPPLKTWPPTTGAEPGNKNLSSTGGNDNQGAQQYDESENITREDIVEDKRVITIIKVTKRNVTTEYRRVTYRWGGLYYFQDNKLSISENVFAFYTGVKE